MGEEGGWKFLKTQSSGEQMNLLPPGSLPAAAELQNLWKPFTLCDRLLMKGRPGLLHLPSLVSNLPGILPPRGGKQRGSQEGPTEPCSLSAGLGLKGPCRGPPRGLLPAPSTCPGCETCPGINGNQMGRTAPPPGLHQRNAQISGIVVKLFLGFL